MVRPHGFITPETTSDVRHDLLRLGRGLFDVSALPLMVERREELGLASGTVLVGGWGRNEMIGRTPKLHLSYPLP